METTEAQKRLQLIRVCSSTEWSAEQLSKLSFTEMQTLRTCLLKALTVKRVTADLALEAVAQKLCFEQKFMKPTKWQALTKVGNCNCLVCSV